MKAKTSDVPEPKRFLASTFWLSVSLTFVASVAVGLIAGYILALNVHSEARQTVVSDMQLASKASQQK